MSRRRTRRDVESTGKPPGPADRKLRNAPGACLQRKWSRPSWAAPIFPFLGEKLERAKGFEPSTPTLARSCSTPELHPHPWDCRLNVTGDRRPMPNAECECNSQQWPIKKTQRPELAANSAQKRP